MERLQRKNTKIIRQFFAEHCQNTQIGNVRDIAMNEDLGVLLGIPFYPEEIVIAPNIPDLINSQQSPFVLDDEEERIYANDCLAHVAARQGNIGVLEALVNIFGHNIIHQENDYGNTPRAFLLACRTEEYLPVDKAAWLMATLHGRRYKKKNNIIRSRNNFDSLYRPKSYSIAVLVSNDYWEKSTYRALVHLINCARHHGYLFSFDYINFMIVWSTRNTANLFVLNQALSILPRERWAGVNGLLYELLNAIADLSQRDGRKTTVIDALLIRCIHHFSTEEWLTSYRLSNTTDPVEHPISDRIDASQRYDAEDRNRSYALAERGAEPSFYEYTPFSAFLRLKFHSKNEQYVGTGISENVLTEAFQTFPLSLWKGYPVYEVLTDNRKRVFGSLRALVERLCYESEETVRMFTAPDETNSHINSFLASLNVVDLQPNEFFSLFRPLLHTHPFTFSVMKQIIHKHDLLELLDSLEGEQLMIENVTQTLFQQDQDGAVYSRVLLNKEWNNPMIVLQDIVMRDTDVQRHAQTDETIRLHNRLRNQRSVQRITNEHFNDVQARIRQYYDDDDDEIINEEAAEQEL
jgi:hypothetical protein